MYKLILADDEVLIRNNMMESVHWEEHGFQVIGCYSNGDEVLDALGEELPDLVITDINMPYVDGIELAKYLYQNYSKIKVIFLTGYNEFEYAKKAMEYGVTQYILKPVTAADIYRILDEMKELLDSEYKELNNRMELEEFYESNEPILRNMLVAQILSGKISLKEIKVRTRMLKMESLEKSVFQVACIQTDRAATMEEGWLEQRRMKVFQRMQNLLEERKLGFAIVDHLGCSVLFCLGSEEGVYYRAELEMFLEEFRSWFEKHEDFTVTIGIGGLCNTLEFVSHSYRDAASALKYQDLLGTNRLIYLEDMEPYRDVLNKLPEEYVEKICKVVKIGDPKELKEAVEEYAEWMNKNGCQGELLRLKVLDAAVRISEEILPMGYPIEYELYGEGLRRIVSSLDADEAMGSLLAFCQKMMEKIYLSRSSHHDGIVREAKLLVEEHYADVDFQIEDVCQWLNLSVSYFRAIFKKETGSTFGNYLKGVRMKKAWNLVLETDLLNYEIAEKVGYSDSSYFGYCFKKRYHMSPNDVRKKILESVK